MKRTFIEANDFQKQVESLNEVDLLQSIQKVILKGMQIGVLLAGTGGIRKFRLGVTAKEKVVAFEFFI